MRYSSRLYRRGGFKASPAVPSGPVLLIHDSFAGSGVLSGATPDTVNTPGNVWQRQGTGKFNYDGAGRVQSSSSDAHLIIDCGQSNHLVKMMARAVSGFVPIFSMICRGVDDKNFWKLERNGVTGSLSLIEITNDSADERVVDSPPSVAVGVDHEMILLATTTEVEGYLKDARGDMGAYTSTAKNTGQEVGLYNEGAPAFSRADIDWFKVWDSE